MPRADLRHPALHPVADAADDAPRKQPREGSELHGGQRDVAKRHGQHTDRDGQLGRGGQSRGSLGDTRLAKAVLPQPQLGYSGVLDRESHLPETFGREGGFEHDTE